MKPYFLVALILLSINKVQADGGFPWFLLQLWPFNDHVVSANSTAPTLVNSTIELTINVSNETSSESIKDSSSLSSEEYNSNESNSTSSSEEEHSLSTSASSDEATTDITSTAPSTPVTILPHSHSPIIRKKPTNSIVDIETTTSTPGLQTTATDSTPTVTFTTHSTPTTATKEKCVKYNSDELYSLLASVGGVNQQFMADSVDKAGINFVDLSEQDKSLDNDVIPMVNSGQFISLENITNFNRPCDERCQQV